jgi:ESS family glutamate:Na+ symporter
VKFTAGLLAPDSAKIIWGFFFVFGLLIAILVRSATRFIDYEYLIDPGIQRRITGWALTF